jgi:hypothetical protein
MGWKIIITPWKQTWKEIYETRFKNYYYWLKVMMSSLAILLTANMGMLPTLILIMLIWGLIDYDYPEKPFMRGNRVTYRQKVYYFVAYVDDNTAEICEYQNVSKDFYMKVQRSEIEKY